MTKEKEKPEPTFVEQANSIIEENYSHNGDEYGMTIKDHKLLVKILDAHEKYVDENITAPFVSKISDYFNPIMQRFEKKLDNVVLDMADVKKRLSVMEDKVSVEERRLNTIESWQERKKVRIDNIENKLNSLEPDKIKEYADDTRAIRKKFTWYMIIIYIVAISIIVASIVAILHQNGAFSFNRNQGNLEQWGKDLREMQEHNSGTTRSIKTHELTDQERTALQDEREKMIKPYKMSKQ
jgi:hypothetical protein